MYYNNSWSFQQPQISAAALKTVHVLLAGEVVTFLQLVLNMHFGSGTILVLKINELY
jgi:hypothetical protein